MKTHIYFSTSVAIGICSCLMVFTAWNVAEAEMDTLNQQIVTTTVTQPQPEMVLREKAPAQTVKGVYLTASSANNPKKLDEIIDLIDKTELNAVVIDIKDYTGNILYDSKVPLVNKLGTKRVVLKDVPGVIKKLHDHNIYVIARQTVFQDPTLAEKKPEWSIANKNGGLWHDNKGLSWVDASRKEVWNYDIAIAKEAAALGFDEINFDYIRFPSDGPIKQMKYFQSDKKKYEVMGEFYAYVREEMKDQPVWTSFDMFGLVMDAKGTNDLGIGQRLVDAMGNADYIDPMMYPSHYAKGYGGFANPADHPAEVFAEGLKKGVPAFASSTTKVRPWVQAFNLGAVYDAAKIRAQIDVVEKYTDAGWLMWNASNRYSSDGLKSK